MTKPSDIRPSGQIRQDFLDFFKSKQHTIVPSSSLMPDSPNLLFTNAGMNQFVPIFLGQVKCPYNPPRAADTQKCIRAGGKHNDLDDVGLDTYHHTFFEMLGNWSFGDYFKKEAIDWAWELITEVWKFPKERLYATVYSPDKSQGDPSEFDQEAHDIWAAKFSAAGLDPKVHIVYGNKKDNFWMMGETGPCGPCSELHVDLTPAGDTKGSLVNKGDARCIEIWNLVFIQFNANPDGTFSPLPARHVDTGMGFERATSIIQGTKSFQDFAHAKISNYETDIFRPIFDKLEELSGKKYGSTLPKTGNAGETEQEKVDVAFRVIGDHIRTLSFAIADGIQPGNTDRNYVLRRILRRAVRYGRTLGFHEPFFYKLVDLLAETMGNVFPEIRAKQKHVQETIQREEEAFNKTLDQGISFFTQAIDYREAFNAVLPQIEADLADPNTGLNWYHTKEGRHYLSFSENELRKLGLVNHASFLKNARSFAESSSDENWDKRNLEFELSRHNLKQLLVKFSGNSTFLLYDTYGFPYDLTELMARERGMTVDKEGFDKLMEEQKTRARAAQKKEVISLSDIGTVQTEFVGYDQLESDCRILKTFSSPEGGLVAVVDKSPLYAEMGGQVGDAGHLQYQNQSHQILNTVKQGHAFLLKLQSTDEEPWLPEGEAPLAHLNVDKPRRNAIQRHHTVTHLLHWALRKVAGDEVSQKGSFVGPDKLTFDFNSAPLTFDQINRIDRLVNEKILENQGVSWIEVPYSEVKNRKDVMQFFGDKYGDSGARGANRRRGKEIGRLFDGTLRRNACACHRRDRPFSNYKRDGNRSWCAANRGRRRLACL